MTEGPTMPKDMFQKNYDIVNGHRKINITKLSFPPEHLFGFFKDLDEKDFEINFRGFDIGVGYAVIRYGFICKSSHMLEEFPIEQIARVLLKIISKSLNPSSPLVLRRMPEYSLMNNIVIVRLRFINEGHSLITIDKLPKEVDEMIGKEFLEVSLEEVMSEFFEEDKERFGLNK